MTEVKPVCVACGRSSDEVPLIRMVYRQAENWICPQHLPILIHKPAQLAGKLPGAANLSSPEGHSHEDL
jgi:hypothetical protein